MKPDPASGHIDPFFAQTTLALFCDVADPITGQPYERDPRSIAKKAESYMASLGIGDKAYFGPEAEFFIFDDVRFSADPYNTGFRVDFVGAAIELGHRVRDGQPRPPPAHQGRLLPGPARRQLPGHPLRDALGDGRDGRRPIEKHHHEVAAAQHELGMKFGTLVRMADHLQIYKYAIHNVAQAYGKTATFMPKPVFGDNGSGMHVHQSIWKGDTPVFAGNKYSDLSDMCLNYIGGILKHAKAINAFTNPLTNSYKRLVPGYEAPVLLAYSARNRSASCRIPVVSSPKGKRVEVRFPDPGANPYLAFAAMLMAGLDGITNKIDPGQAMDKNLYDLPPAELAKIPTVCGSLREALENLDKNRGFLKMGGVFTDDMIDAYIELRMAENMRYEMTPHPVEYDMYYSV